MKAMGKRNTWSRQSSAYIVEVFSFEVPAGGVTHFDASQSTVTLKNAHGHTLLAFKNITEFWLDTVDITWTVEETLEQHMEDLKKQLAEIQAQNRFLREQQDV